MPACKRGVLSVSTALVVTFSDSASTTAETWLRIWRAMLAAGRQSPDRRRSRRRTRSTGARERRSLRSSVGNIGAVLLEAGRLEGEHRCVSPVGGYQVIVGSDLDDGTVLEHDDAVRAA